MPQPEFLAQVESPLVNAYRRAWLRIKQEQDRLSADPRLMSRKQRLAEMRAAIEAEMDNLDEATAEWIQHQFPKAYAAGAVGPESVGAMVWSQIHQQAAQNLAQDLFNDLLAATKGVKDSTKALIREIGKQEAEFSVIGGNTAQQAGRVMQRTLAEHGIHAVTYADGSRHSLTEYAEMSMRTKTAVAFNQGTLNQHDVQYFEVFDGPECGTSAHDSGDIALGQIWTRDQCFAYPISHPNCRRSFGPRPDILTKQEIKDLTPDQADALAAQRIAELEANPLTIGAGGVNIGQVAAQRQQDLRRAQRQARVANRKARMDRATARTAKLQAQQETKAIGAFADDIALELPDMVAVEPDAAHVEGWSQLTFAQKSGAGSVGGQAKKAALAKGYSEAEAKAIAEQAKAEYVAKLLGKEPVVTAEKVVTETVQTGKLLGYEQLSFAEKSGVGSIGGQAKKKALAAGATKEEAEAAAFKAKQAAILKKLGKTIEELGGAPETTITTYTTAGGRVIQHDGKTVLSKYVKASDVPTVDELIASGLSVGDAQTQWAGLQIQAQKAELELEKQVKPALKAAIKANPTFVDGDLPAKWYDQLVEDTAPGEWVGVSDIVVGHNYILDEGLALRRNGVTYVLERAPGQSAEEMLAELEAQVKIADDAMQSVPEAMRQYQKGVVVTRSSSPGDAYWQKQFNNPNHKAVATGGNGVTTFWNTQVRPGTFLHEFGHNVDSGIGAGPGAWVSDLDQWQHGMKADVDSGVFHDAHGFTGSIPGHQITAGKSGVTVYGQNNNHEDFAESVRLYFADRHNGYLGYTNVVGDAGMQKVSVRFADVFPLRAKQLDGIFGLESKVDTPFQIQAEAKVVKLLKDAEKASLQSGEGEGLLKYSSFELKQQTGAALRVGTLGELKAKAFQEANAEIAAEKAAAAEAAAKQAKALQKALEDAKALEAQKAGFGLVKVDESAHIVEDQFFQDVAGYQGTYTATQMVPLQKALLEQELAVPGSTKDWSLAKMKGLAPNVSDTNLLPEAQAWAEEKATQLLEDAKNELAVKLEETQAAKQAIKIGADNEALVSKLATTLPMYDEAYYGGGIADELNEVFAQALILQHEGEEITPSVIKALSHDKLHAQEQLTGPGEPAYFLQALKDNKSAADLHITEIAAELQAAKPAVHLSLEKAMAIVEGDSAHTADLAELVGSSTAEQLKPLKAQILLAEAQAKGGADKLVTDLIANGELNQRMVDLGVADNLVEWAQESAQALKAEETAQVVLTYKDLSFADKTGIGVKKANAKRKAYKAEYDKVYKDHINGFATHEEAAKLADEAAKKVANEAAATVERQEIDIRLAKLYQERGLPVVTGAQLGQEAGSEAMRPGLATKAKRDAGSHLARAKDIKHPLAKVNDQGYSVGVDIQNKSNIAAEIGSRMNNRTDWDSFVKYRQDVNGIDPEGGQRVYTWGDLFRNQLGVSPSADRIVHLRDSPIWNKSIDEALTFDEVPEEMRQYVLDSEASQRVQSWAQSSGDTHTKPVAMQMAAKDEFGIGAESDPFAAFSKNAYGGITREATVAVYEASGDFYRRFLRHMYNHTQDEFRREGITEIAVYRGMFQSHYNLPEWVPKSTTTGGAEGAGRAILQPMNSWSSRASISHRFGQVKLEATFPVSRVIGSARTGFGCTNEFEYVVFHSEGEAQYGRF